MLGDSNGIWIITVCDFPATRTLQSGHKQSSYLRSISNTSQCRGSGNLLISGQKLSQCATFVCGCYEHKAGSNQSAPPIQSHLDVMQYGGVLYKETVALCIY